jgi:hypothetical protein
MYAHNNLSTAAGSARSSMRKPYQKPMIVHEIALETHAQLGSVIAPLDPGTIDPVLPEKPDSSTQDDPIDPPLPAKPPRPSSDGGTDPPLPPKPKP